MNHRFIYISLFCIFFHYAAVCQTPFSSEVDSLILESIDYTFMSQFDSAMAVLQPVVDRYPDHIVGYFYQAATLQSKMMDYETDLWENDFNQNIEQAISVGKKQIEDGKQDPWTYFYLGNAFSYKGLYQAKHGGLISGFINARKGLHYLEKAVEMDSSLYDAYLTIGNFKYWEGRFYRYLKWLPWVKDERRTGIRMVRQSIRKGAFSYWVGMNSLAWIEFDRKRFQVALYLFRQGLERYPGSRFFLWGVAHTCFRLEIYQDAVVCYQQLLDLILSENTNNGYNEAECHLKLGLCFYELEDYRKAVQHFDAVLDRKVDPKIARRLDAHYQEASIHRKKSVKAMKM